MNNGRITLTMIKPYAVKQHHVGAILSRIEKEGFHIRALKMTQLPAEKAEIFYEEHAGKSFFPDLIEFMSSGPVVVAILEKDNAVDDFRKLIGNTDPTQAEEGTIRRTYAKDKTRNAIHGSDSDESAKRETRFFFSSMEEFPY
ncbi:nucleoside-diphosphate kinase [Natronoflexus pectinivorans]|uniref:Nucleoside diphosphate kinase n=1 Tax=Natronoflexus pectinivorans TaxID=682526 RepID=A0A4R2GKA9_9BACT|nr:nucleoside-diphosphate kinase [Natronoflexus pectinivorans]TCO09281.1 nucleoside diphosphate kinase [Natronoflexus pectinivorans]